MITTPRARTEPDEVAGPSHKDQADALLTGRASRKGLLRRRPELILSPLLLIAIIAAWQIIVTVRDVSTFVVPPPKDVFEALWKNTREGTYNQHLIFTVRNSLTGFVFGTVLGVLVGAALAASRTLERVLHPYLVAFQTFPKIALVPMLIIWFGFDATPKVIIAGILAFFPVMVNSFAGLVSVDTESEELMRSLRASPWETFIKLRLPTALPFIFAGLELALVLAILGAVTGEFLGSKEGLGFLVQQFSTQLRTEDSFSLLFVFGVLGMGAHVLVSWIRKRVIYWQ